jgi:hypothetical protein
MPRERNVAPRSWASGTVRPSPSPSFSTRAIEEFCPTRRTGTASTFGYSFYISAKLCVPAQDHVRSYRAGGASRRSCCGTNHRFGVFSDSPLGAFGQMAKTGVQRKPSRRKAAGRKLARASSGQPRRYWSGRVTRESNALDLERGVFTWSDPRRIAASLKRSAEQSGRRKADPYRSALSMLVFYINRAGKTLPATRRRTLEKAKTELRRQFGRE